MTMYLASLDHCPSEQFVSPQTWHTSVLVLSENGFDAENLASVLEVSNGLPRKWSKSSKRHKSEFHLKLRDQWKPEHFIFALSVQAGAIQKNFADLLAQLKLAKLVVEIQKNDKTYITFGPFYKSSDGSNSVSEERFTLPLNQAMPIKSFCFSITSKVSQLSQVCR